jgi:hypothetical protein
VNLQTSIQQLAAWNWALSYLAFYSIKNAGPSAGGMEQEYA